jgi:hypothetical protein
MSLRIFLIYLENISQHVITILFISIFIVKGQFILYFLNSGTRSLTGQLSSFKKGPFYLWQQMIGQCN